MFVKVVLVGQSVGRSVGRSIGRSVAFYISLVVISCMQAEHHAHGYKSNSSKGAGNAKPPERGRAPLLVGTSRGVATCRAWRLRSTLYTFQTMFQGEKLEKKLPATAAVDLVRNECRVFVLE